MLNFEYYSTKTTPSTPTITILNSYFGGVWSDPDTRRNSRKVFVVGMRHETCSNQLKKGNILK
jgi:hypothetical protein